MTRDEALQKIKKCLALGASPNEHEAAAAMRQAQKLMQQFGLSDADISLADVSEFEQKAYNAPLVRWEAMLALSVADAFGCTYFTSTSSVLGKSFNRRTLRHFVFVGVGAAAEVAGYAFEVLSRQCAKGRREHMTKQPKNCKPKTKVARGDLYAEGWAFGVKCKLDEFTRSEKQETLLSQYVEKNYPSLSKTEFKDRTKGKNVTENDFGHGFRAGQEADLHHGLDQAAAKPQLTRSAA